MCNIHIWILLLYIYMVGGLFWESSSQLKPQLTKIPQHPKRPCCCFQAQQSAALLSTAAQRTVVALDMERMCRVFVFSIGKIYGK